MTRKKDTPLARLIRARMADLDLTRAEVRRKLAQQGSVVSRERVRFWLDGHMPAMRYALALAHVLKVDLVLLCSAAEDS